MGFSEVLKVKELLYNTKCQINQCNMSDILDCCDPLLRPRRQSHRHPPQHQVGKEDISLGVIDLKLSLWCYNSKYNSNHISQEYNPLHPLIPQS